MIEVMEKGLEIADSHKLGNTNKHIGDDKQHKIVLVSPFFDNFGRTNLNYGIYRVLAISFFIFYVSSFIIFYLIFDEDYSESLAKTIETTIISILWYINWLINGVLSVFSSISYYIMGFLKAIVYIVWKLVHIYLENKEYDAIFTQIWNFLEKNNHFDFAVPYLFEIPRVEKIRMNFILIITGVFFCSYIVQYYIQRVLFSAKLTSYYVPLPFMYQFFKRKEKLSVDLYLLPSFEHNRIHSSKALDYCPSALFGESLDDYEVKYKIDNRYLSYYTRVTIYLQNKNITSYKRK